MTDTKTSTGWFIPTAPGVDRVAHLIHGGPHPHPNAVTRAACGKRHQRWAVREPDSDAPRCMACRAKATPAGFAPPPPSGTWWAPTSMHTHRKVRAHLLPNGATGTRGSALCGETRAGWQPIDADSLTHCRACEVIGNGTGRRSATRSEARSAALVAAGFCLDQGLGAEELRELLSALLDNPGEARRAS